MFKKLIHTTIAGVGAVLLLGGGAYATTLTPDNSLYVETITGNDCAGEWGRPFADCESPEEYGSSPIIAKFEAGGTSEYNTLVFPSLGGSEITISISGDTVEWSYAPGTDDPSILVVTLKRASEFDVFWDGGSAITSGVFSTSNGQDISHVAFYDTGDDPGEFVIPVPASLPLLLAGIAGFGVMGRRKARKSA